jgi:hypothetical protein
VNIRVLSFFVKILSGMERNGMWNEKKLMKLNGNGMKVVESL